MRFLEGLPGTFHKLPYKRNNVESVSQSVKERFGGVVRAVETNTRPLCCRPRAYAATA